jgi:hypothetical protein
MRRVSKTAAFFALVLLGVALHGGNAAANGVTVTPATVTLTLVPDSQQQSAEFSLTNNYDAPITLRFAFEPRLDATSTQNPVQQLSVSKPELVLAPKETIKQVITVHDNSQLGPGSQLADLVISQLSTPGANITVQPGIRMPVVVVKQDGAIASLALTNTTAPRVSLSMPDTLGVTIHNKGNVVSIPRGVITVSGPGGEAKQGVLNTSSQAVAPGENVTLRTPLTELGGTQLPGFYHVTVSYGLGGDQKPVSASSTFFYIAWWHIALLVLTAVAARYFMRYSRRPQRKKPSASHHPPKNLLLRKRTAS